MTPSDVSYSEHQAARVKSSQPEKEIKLYYSEYSNQINNLSLWMRFATWSVLYGVQPQQTGSEIDWHENSIFTRQMSFPLLASRQNHPPNSRGQGIFPTRAIYFPDNTFSNRPPTFPGSEHFLSKPACVISELFHFYPFLQKNYHGGVAPPQPPWWRPCCFEDFIFFARMLNRSTKWWP